MTRIVLTTNHGENNLRHTVRLASENNPGQGQEGYRALMEFMQSICYLPDLIRHDGPCPERLNIIHDGSRWTMESITVVSRPTE